MPALCRIRIEARPRPPFSILRSSVLNGTIPSPAMQGAQMIQECKTGYSKNVIDAIIARKGGQRADQYLRHKTERTRYLEPLFEFLRRNERSGMKVLEVGCSAGHITEYLNEQDCIGEIRTYDVDRAMVEITRIKQAELGLAKVKSVDELSTAQTLELPYDTGYFDLIIVLAVVEHLPFESRHAYVDAYYRKLKVGGLIAFFDTPNRYYPFDWHSTRLFFIQGLPPQVAFLYAKLFGRLKGVGFQEFTRAGTGWRNSSYYELLPKGVMVDIEDISGQAGYPDALYADFRKGLKRFKPRYLHFKIIGFLSRLIGFPMGFFTPSMDVVFRKTREYE
jgi:2-polyprenyl-3-methyl-5-hydroxy-6-metoxy-1,4-benzoquinol methylase